MNEGFFQFPIEKRMYHRSASQNPGNFGHKPRKKVTWSSAPNLWPLNNPQSSLPRRSLYGPALQDLCMQTQDNLRRLASSRTRGQNIFLTLQTSGRGNTASTPDLFANDHQNPEPNQDARKLRESTTRSGGALRSKEAIKYLQGSIKFDGYPSDDSNIETDLPEPAYTLCYFCSTKEEHRKHMRSRNHIPKPRKIKPRYVAPRPKVRVRSAPSKIQTLVNHQNLYKLTLCTGDVDGAGTSADVYIGLEGTNNYLPLTKLQKSSGSVKFTFQRNSKEIFYVRGPFLGELKTLVVEMLACTREIRKGIKVLALTRKPYEVEFRTEGGETRGSRHFKLAAWEVKSEKHSGLENVHSWFLDSVEVCDVSREHSWKFKCGQWLSLHSGKRRLRLMLDSSQNSEEYKIIMETGNCRMAGTNSNIFITLHGSQSQSDKLLLADPRKKCFQRGSIDTFVVKTQQPLGQLKKIRIEHDNTGAAPGWYLKKITIENLNGAGLHESTNVFIYNGWLADDTEGGKLWCEIEEQKYVSKAAKEEKLKKYQISTTTGTRRFSGTSARVFIQIIGAKEKTSKLTLKSGGNCFQKGATDLFEVEAIDVGQIQQILIGHDNSGIGSGWFLEQVVVRSYERNDEDTTTTSGKSKQHRKHSKAIGSTRRLSDISDISDEEEHNGKNDVLLKTKSMNNSKKKMELPAYIEYMFICEQWLATNEGDGKTSRSLEVTDLKFYK